MSIYKDLRLKYKNHQLKVALTKAKKVLDFSKIPYANKNVLIIDSIIPEFDKDSGSRRLFKIINILLSHGFGVFLIADKKEYKYNTDYVAHYRKLGVVVYEPSIDQTGAFVTKETFIEAILPKIDFAWLHRADVFKTYSQLVSSNKSIKLIYDMVDFHYLRFIREWENTKDSKTKMEAEKYLDIEVENCRLADKIITISEQDKNALKEFYSEENKMVTIGNVHQFLDVEKTPFKHREGLFFVGGFSHKPNQDAVLFLYHDIMPLVWKKNKHIKVTIVGSYPTKDMLDLNSDRFKVLGYVEDISEYFNTSRVFVAPLRYGAGVKGKIGQSLEYGLPLVTTPIGAEGFDFKAQADHVIDTTAQGLANKILKLYQDETVWKEVSEASKEVLEPFSISHIEEQVLKVLK
ncbi:glycosyltransferase family 4 protein [Xanthomarina gelatinilytica]|jgi:glycosyltransferase involved in cell wall biosynthesis|uniref:glycosyltransferase family 4 protein n=1 Tax=Xanthomarina gelatinilytica TaxID=1137281 RepID=UPI001D83FA12|nr:glycosyltransferase family 4 protein [Winogradskyella sp.]MDX1316318.1 glycosyltransferase family 4 protein [Xanthomarina gelatinilytica]